MTATARRRFRRVSTLLPLIFVALELASTAPAPAADHRLGLGVHFWKTADDLVDDRFDGIEDDGLAWVLSYRYDPKGLINFQIDLEYFDDGFGGSTSSAVAPIGYILLGNKLYAGVGAGVTVSSGLADDVSDPFFAARVGYELTLLPGIRLDLNANYRADAFEDLGDASTDAVTLGAVVRFKL